MNKLLVLAALTVAAAPAMASKARLTALGNANHLIDTQTIFVNTADINYLGDFATLEFGGNVNSTTPAANSTTPRAEGGFVRSSSMGKWGAYLGRQSSTVNDFVNAVNTSLGAEYLLHEQNSLDLFYGTEMAANKWGFGLHYSSAKKESDAATLGNQEINTLGLSVGVRNDVWDAYGRFGLMGETKSDWAALGTPKLQQKGLYDLGFGYWMDTVYLSAKFLTTKGTLSAGGTDTDIEKTQWSLSAIDNVKVEGGTFFYGIQYGNTEVKSGNAKDTVNGLPVIVGMEVDATTWMVLRGSISQNVLLADHKVEVVGSTTDKLINNTVVAAGAGFKFGKMMLDATLAGSNSTGQVDGDHLLANGSLTYMF